jgi:hypothetical protein
MDGVPKLDASTEAKIKQDWKKYDGSRPLIGGRYYGTYNGYVVFWPTFETHDDFFTRCKIAGTIFRGNGLIFYLWKDGVFYSGLRESYLKGRLTSADISKIGEIYVTGLKKAWVGSESSFDEWYFKDDIRYIIE